MYGELKDAGGEIVDQTHAAHWRAQQDLIRGNFDLCQHPSCNATYCGCGIGAEGCPCCTPPGGYRRGIGEPCLSAKKVVDWPHDLALSDRLGQIHLDSEQGPTGMPNQVSHRP